MYSIYSYTKGTSIATVTVRESLYLSYSRYREFNWLASYIHMMVAVVCWSYVSLSSIDEVTEATSKFSLTVDTLDALLPVERRR